MGVQMVLGGFGGSLASSWPPWDPSGPPWEPPLDLETNKKLPRGPSKSHTSYLMPRGPWHGHCLIALRTAKSGRTALWRAF